MNHIVAIDIGGTKTVGGLFTLDGRLVDKVRVPTKTSLGRENLLSTLYDIVDNYTQHYTVVCVSIGSAGRINMTDGSVFYASDNLPNWTGVNLKKLMEDKYGIPTIVENDCKVTGIGEAWLGSAVGYDSYVVIALGTGVGAAVKVEGTLIHGAHWSAGELGHMTLYPDGRQCNCGLKGCLEQYCSGTALVKRFNTLSQTQIQTGYQFFELIENQDATAQKVLDEFVHDLSTTIISLSNIYDPDIFVIGGGLIDTKEHWWQDLMQEISNSPLNSIIKPKVVPAILGSDAALYGAAYLGINYKGINLNGHDVNSLSR